MPSEDFSKVFTIEHFVYNEYWQVVSTHNSLNEAVNKFREYCRNDYATYRLTTPTDPTIYE